MPCVSLCVCLVCYQGFFCVTTLNNSLAALSLASIIVSAVARFFLLSLIPAAVVVVVSTLRDVILSVPVCVCAYPSVCLFFLW